MHNTVTESIMKTTPETTIYKHRCFQGYCRHLGQGAVAAGG